VARLLGISFGCVWAASLLLFGLRVEGLWTNDAGLIPGDEGLWDQVAWGLSLFAIGGAQFVFMFFVADELCPRTPTMIRALLKFLTGVLALSSLIWVGWLIWPAVV